MSAQSRIPRVDDVKSSSWIQVTAPAAIAAAIGAVVLYGWYVQVHADNASSPIRDSLWLLLLAGLLTLLIVRLVSVSRQARLQAEALSAANLRLEADIREREAAQIALHDSEREMRALFAALPDLIMILDRNGRYLQIAPTNPELLYRPSSEIEGRTIHEVFPADQAALYQNQIDQALATGQAQELEYSLVVDQRTIWFGAIVAPRDADSVFWLARDISMRKEVERALAESDERFRQLARQRAAEELRASHNTVAALFTASPVPMLLLDTNAQVTRWNPAAEGLFGWTEADVIGRLLPFAPEFSRQGHQSLLERPLRGEHVSNVEIILRRQDASTVRVLISAAPIIGDADQVLAIMGILVDITEQRSLEEQLRQAQKMEAVGRLAGGIAHDFNNVLTAIQGYASLLFGDTAPTDERREDILQILHAADRAASFTRQLLAFSRKQVIQPMHYELNTLLAELKLLLARVIGDHIELQFELSSEWQFVLADKGQLEQIVINLVVNARDAVDPAGGGRIVLRTACREVGAEEAAQLQDIAAGLYCVIEVEDNGCGISAEAMEHIFEPFFTTKDVGKGTGLGLATVYGMLQQNHGIIRVKSIIGAGSTFSVFLPHSTPDASAPAASVVPVAAAAAPEQQCVLVVEDEPAIRNLIRRVLQRAGDQVLSAADPVAALEILARQDFDILLTDLMLPHMTGQELARRVHQQRPEVVIIYMSGYADEQIDVGVPYLEKPFTPADLLQKLRQLNVISDDEPAGRFAPFEALS